MAVKIHLNEKGELRYIAVTPDVSPTPTPVEDSQQPQWGLGEFGDDRIEKANAKFVKWAEVNRRELTVKPNNALVAVAGIATAIALLISSGSCGGNSNHEKIVAVPATEQDVSNYDTEQCVFRGIRRFRAPKDMDVSEAIPLVAGIEDMPQCRNDALREIILKNSTHTRYAVTHFDEGERHRMPIRVLVKGP